MIEINLLPPHDLLTQKERVFRQIFKRLAAGVTAFMVLLIAAVFMAGRFFAGANEAAQREHQDLLNRFAGQATEAQQIVELRRKAEGILSIDRGGLGLAVMADRTNRIFSPALGITRMNLAADGTVRLTLLAADVENLVWFFNQIDSPVSTSGPRLVTVQIPSLQQNGDGSFLVDLAGKYQAK